MANELSAWDRLTAIATLGTRRGSMPNTTWPDSLEAASVADSPEKTLLRAAAATSVWNLAGRRAAIDATVEIIQSAPIVPTQSLASEAASMRLMRMMAGDRRELIAEWFELAQTAAKSLAPHWLAVVLDVVPAKLRNQYPRVLGPAAAWLAHLNPQWTVSSIVDEPSEQRWHEGTIQERRAELVSMRKHDPSRAREWLVGTWSADPPEARETFLRALQVRLSADDEAFLEQALDDKRKGVRQAAVEALALMPYSAHARRNYERLESLIVFEEKKSGVLGTLSKRKLMIQLPAGIDKSAQRDGIESRPPAQRKIGERTFWLVQMIALAAPNHWIERFGCDAATFIDAAMSSEYALDLLSALSEAASRYPDPKWLTALCDAWLDSKQEQHVVAQATARLIASAPLETRGSLFEAQAEKLAKRNIDALLYLIENVDIGWTASITALAIDQIAARARSERQQWSHSRNALDAWAQRCDVPTALRLVPQAIAAAGEQSPWRNALEQFNDIVEFRAAMQRELM
jgi:Family of unknown function (DUF5691)